MRWRRREMLEALADACEDVGLAEELFSRQGAGAEWPGPTPQQTEIDLAKVEARAKATQEVLEWLKDHVACDDDLWNAICSSKRLAGELDEKEGHAHG